MSSEVPNTNARRGPKSGDGRHWTNAEVFTFLGFLNDQRNDGWTSKFVSPLLKKVSGFMREKFPQRNWKYDSTLRSQFRRIRDDWLIFKDILDAPGTEWDSRANSFTFSSTQPKDFIKKHGTRASRIIDRGILMNKYITIDTYANIFRDGPEAGRNNMVVDEIVRVDSSNGPEDAPSGADDVSYSNGLHLLATRPKQRTKKATPAESATPKPSHIAKATPKKTPRRASFWTVESVVDTMICARLRSTESQNHIVALRDIARDENGFSRSLTTALLCWIQNDPETNAVIWNTIQSTKKKFHFLSTQPGFEGIEFPSNLE
ncbi:hypothetical protein E4U17_007636 [Claviceps sp. LM77 group G4]|nr:hypothetical protein E4U17_007636 [Claviceps sp. LM77 group G4]KAG6056422.1 hypothetical protein E4U33_007691 [Claviceps sp. LM78 group G4]KAG6080154.1 hypothetical protein E4U16_000562 [Claviceps sp. LM84 group G4]